MDHVLLGTGYKIDIARCSFLSEELLQGVRTVHGYPVLNGGFESSLAGLYFAGATAAYSFGPLLRFVAGTQYAAGALSRHAVEIPSRRIFGSFREPPPKNLDGDIALPTGGSGPINLLLAARTQARKLLATIRSFHPFRLLSVAVAGRINQSQQEVIAYLKEENRVLRQQLGVKPLRLSDDQRRRLAARAKTISRKALPDVAMLVTPETLVAWHRKLIAKKSDGNDLRIAGRLRIMERIKKLVAWMAPENRVQSYTRIKRTSRNFGRRVAATVRSISLDELRPSEESAEQILSMHAEGDVGRRAPARNSNHESALGTLPVLEEQSDTSGEARPPRTVDIAGGTLELTPVEEAILTEAGLSQMGVAGEETRPEKTPTLAILVAEMEPGVRGLIRKVLSREGYKTFGAGNASEALGLAATHEGHLDLLLTNCGLPDMGGPELARRLREVSPGLVVTYLSGHEAGNGSDALEPGVRLLEKPFTLNALLSTVRDACGEARRRANMSVEGSRAELNRELATK